MFSYSIFLRITSSYLKKTNIPILLIHGEEDYFVPLEMSRAIHESASNSQLHIFPHAGHGLSYPVDPERYLQIAGTFFSCEEEI